MTQVKLTAEPRSDFGRAHPAACAQAAACRRHLWHRRGHHPLCRWMPTT